jgi:hypothetical protein
VAGGSAFSRPGSRNVAGDTLWEALMPLQPVPQEATPASKTANATFLFKFTKPEYKSQGHARNV